MVLLNEDMTTEIWEKDEIYFNVWDELLELF